MKPLKITITWDKLRQGEFPEKELKECDDAMQITIEKVSTLRQKITLESTIPDEEDVCNVSYEIGSLIATIVTNRYK
jgi:hypothetical protein